MANLFGVAKQDPEHQAHAQGTAARIQAAGTGMRAMGDFFMTSAMNDDKQATLDKYRVAGEERAEGRQIAKEERAGVLEEARYEREAPARESKAIKAQADLEYTQARTKESLGKATGTGGTAKWSEDKKYDIKQYDAEIKSIDTKLDELALDPETNKQMIQDLTAKKQQVEVQKTIRRMSPEERQAYGDRLAKAAEAKRAATAQQTHLASPQVAGAQGRVGQAAGARGGITPAEKARLMNKYFKDSPTAVSEQMLLEAQQAELLQQEVGTQQPAPQTIDRGILGSFPGRL